MLDKVQNDLVKGEVTLWLVDEHTGAWTPKCTVANSVQFYWGSIAAHTFRGETSHLPAGCYIEFKNVASPSDTVPTPSFVRSDNLGYYNGLPSDQDFLRVTLSAVPAISIAAGYSSFFTAPDGNELTFMAQTAGTAGVLGRTFSDSVNSKVFGVGLLAYPVFADRTKDVLFARTYFSGANQQLKLANAQIGVTWKISYL